NDITDCPDTGCGATIDVHLNRQKNIRSSNEEAEDMSLEDIKRLPDPVPGFKVGDRRERLAEVGEGKKIRVVALALVARKGSRESCNCGLLAPADTDNMIVLVERNTSRPTLAKDEMRSVSAEFTPRVRLNHPNLTGAKLQSLITYSRGQALKVRVTGLLMFDSEHSLGH